MHQRVGVDRGGQIILQAAGEMERVLGRDVVDALQQLRVAGPADFDAAEQIGLRARHLEQALRLERGLGAENLRIGLEAHARAAAVVRPCRVPPACPSGCRARTPSGRASGSRATSTSSARGEGVDDRDADAMQAAGGLVDLGIEFAAGVQRAHDDFERGLLREFRMRIDRDAAAIVADRSESRRRSARPR